MDGCGKKIIIKYKEEKNTPFDAGTHAVISGPE